jgi:hypothetical protein
MERVVIWVGGSRRLRYGRSDISLNLGQSRERDLLADDQHRRQSTHGFQMDAATRMHPPLDEITDAMLSKHLKSYRLCGTSTRTLTRRSISSRVWPQGIDTVSCQSAVHYLFKTDDTWTALSITWRTPPRYFIGTTFDGDTVAAQLKKNSGKITGQVGDLVVEYRARVRTLCSRDRRWSMA